MLGGSRFAKTNIDFRTLCERIPQQPPNQFKIVPDIRLEVTGFLMRKAAVGINHRPPKGGYAKGHPKNGLFK